jgi:hypothetical protein
LVVELYEIRLGRAGILNLLKTVSEGDTGNGTVVIEGVVAVDPLEGTCNASGRGAIGCETISSDLIVSIL